MVFFQVVEMVCSSLQVARMGASVINGRDVGLIVCQNA